MDFSLDVLIEFALNLAGYLIVTLLVFVLVARRRQASKTSTTTGHVNVVIPSVKETTPRAAVTAKASSGPEFLSLSGLPARPVKENKGVKPRLASEKVTEKPVSLTVSRQENRRAIYHQARQLLAKGASHRDLLSRLPLTDDEIAMLSATGNA